MPYVYCYIAMGIASAWIHPMMEIQSRNVAKIEGSNCLMNDSEFAECLDTCTKVQCMSLWYNTINEET